MPFQISDVDRHNKGLSDKQKQTWVKIANDALKRCTARGKEANECDTSAIKQANAVLAQNFDFEDYWDVICNYQLTKDPDSFYKALVTKKLSRQEGVFDNFKSAFKELKIKQTFNINDVEIFSVGKWNGDEYTEHDLDQMIEAFSQVGFEPPLKLGHNKKQEDGQPKFGGIQAIRRNGAKLLADFFNIPLKLYEALQRKNFERVSSEIYWNYNSNGRVFPRVLKAVAFLGADIPAVTDLESIGNLYADKNNKDFRIYEFPKNFKKEGQTMTDLEKTQAEQISKLEKENEEGSKKYTDHGKEIDRLKKENADKDKAKKAAEAKLSEQEAKTKAANVDNFIKEMKGKGRILPKFERELKTLMSNISDSEKLYCYTETDKDTGKETKHEFSQLELIQRIFNEMPKLVDYSERSPDEGNFSEDYADDPGKEVVVRIKAYMEKNKEKDYSVAMNAVLDADQGLKDAYAKGGKK